MISVCKVFSVSYKSHILLSHFVLEYNYSYITKDEDLVGNYIVNNLKS